MLSMYDDEFEDGTEALQEQIKEVLSLCTLPVVPFLITAALHANFPICSQHANWPIPVFLDNPASHMQKEIEQRANSSPYLE